ncbi:hypothetical protein, partial [Neomicrococcus lactis]|uniref:hypothetical protein n=1 Tax=Neomicrococcus lactis TaxID=732241 RepID=UPI002300D6FA
GNQAGEQFSPQTQSDGNQPPQPDALQENNDDSQVKTFQEYVRTPFVPITRKSPADGRALNDISRDSGVTYVATHDICGPP